jgi:Fe2+ transport system protein B
VDWIDATVGGVLANWVTVGLTAVAAPAWLISLLVDGVMAGVGGVLMFLPVLLILYFCLALLEDSGYMARAAFVMDRLMHLLGLHGKSFIPLIVGFGCNVPGHPGHPHAGEPPRPHPDRPDGAADELRSPLAGLRHLRRGLLSPAMPAA